MFCYAAGRRLAYHHNTVLKLDLSDYRMGTDQRPKELQAFSRKFMLAAFNIAATEATPAELAALRDPFFSSSTRDRLVRLVRRIQPTFLWRDSHTQEKRYGFDRRILSLGDNQYLSGFWQSEKYFADIGQIIRREFTPRDSRAVESATNLIRSLKQDNSKPIVSLHVRRGDLAYAYERLGAPKLVYGAPIGMEYISRAMARFQSDSRFLVFSDSAEDIEWCRKNIHRKTLFFSEERSAIEDLVLMSLCDHHIIANSSFSWWAAWLDEKPGKCVIAPRNWFALSAQEDLVVNDLIPEQWTLI